MNPPAAYNISFDNIDTALRYEVVIRILAEVYHPDLSILEVGSGAAGITEFLRHPVTGLDPSFERTANRATELLRPVPGTADSIPFRDNSFDVVLSLEMMEHLSRETREAAFREMLRVVKPSGRMIIGFPIDEPAEVADKKLNRLFKKRHRVDHPWIIEHIENGLPKTEEIQSILDSNSALIRTTEVIPHMWVHAWLTMQVLFSVYGGAVKIQRLGLQSKLVLNTCFRLLRLLNFQPSYRKIFVITKKSGV